MAAIDVHDATAPGASPHPRLYGTDPAQIGAVVVTRAGVAPECLQQWRCPCGCNQIMVVFAQDDAGAVWIAVVLSTEARRLLVRLDAPHEVRALLDAYPIVTDRALLARWFTVGLETALVGAFAS